MSEPFIAEVRMMACNFAPRGWAFCDGQLLQIAQNTALFSLIGTTYGGDGRTTMALPDLRDRVPMHAGRGPGLSPRSLGQVIENTPGRVVNAVVDIEVARGLADTTTTRDVDLRLQQSALPPALEVNFCIALQGLFPSRS